MQIVLYIVSMEDFNDYYVPDGEYSKRGFLNEDYKVFSIRDKRSEKFEFHYHEFNKIVFFLSGNVKYVIEGREYVLNPYDVLLVRHGDIHRPVIDPAVEYNRIVLWVDDAFLNKNGNLSKCFNIGCTKKLNFNDINKNVSVFALVKQLADENDDLFESALMKDSLLFQIMILINRFIDNKSNNRCQYSSDAQIDKALEYINSNLFSDLSIDKISDEIFVSRYYLMHKFKAVTGKSVFSYIQTKRLLNAAQLIHNGASAKTACYESGYNDYSVFLKAFKKEFGVTPREYAINKG